MADLPPDDFRRRQRANLITLAIVALLVVGSIVVLLTLHNGIRRETCFAAGHHTCAPVDEHQ